MHQFQQVSLVYIKDGSFSSRPLHPRQHGLEYYVDHRGDQFYIITNADGKNYKVRAAISNVRMNIPLLGIHS